MKEVGTASQMCCDIIVCYLHHLSCTSVNNHILKLDTSYSHHRHTHHSNTELCESLSLPEDTCSKT